MSELPTVVTEEELSLSFSQDRAPMMPEPEEEGSTETTPTVTIPQTLHANRKINNQLWVAGRGKGPSDVMFLASTVHEEEAQEEQKLIYGRTLRNKAAYLKSPAGVILKDTLLWAGVDVDKYYYTALVKFLLPKEDRKRPKRHHIEMGIPVLENEIKEVNPKIIVAFGKPAFEFLVPLKVKFPDIIGGWFFSERFRCRVLAMPDSYTLVTRPDHVDRFRIDFRELYKMIKAAEGVDVTAPIETHYRTVRDMDQLMDLVSEWQAGDYRVFSVDCEWGGRNHVNGKLKSIQFCWKEGHAAYIRFCGPSGEYEFEGGDYRDVGRMLATWLNRPEIKYIGHHISADFPWMHCWLGLNYYNKAMLDTEFAQQCLNENDDFGLERIAMRYTDLGRYDLELYLWVKANKQPQDAGYMHIPDEILIPYACRDVDVPFRAYPHVVRQLLSQKLLTYYNSIFNPFVTNVFTEFAIVGLPIDIDKLDELRLIYHYAKQRLNVKFVERIVQESSRLLFMHLYKVTKDVMVTREHVQKFETFRSEGKAAEGWALIKNIVGPGKLQVFKPVFDHFMEAASFNIRSSPKMQRWLFDVKGLTPIKTTGKPSLPWEKVCTYPEHIRKEYSPAVDKQTLQILSEKDSLVGKLLELNAVGNIAKAFLKEASVDDDGEIVKENGLHYWICQDSRVHGQMSTTETGRPRSWNPNVYNWPSWVNKQIIAGIGEIILEDRARGILPEEFEKYIVYDEEEQEWVAKVPSLRSSVTSPEGWVLVESDYQTAEIRGLAFISGDSNLIKLILEPDQDFGLVAGEKAGDKEVVRLKYAESSGISHENQNPDFLLAKVVEGKIIARYTEADLLRDNSGQLLHPKADLHWSLAEMVHAKPREVLSDKRDRGAAKVGNFSSAYGASPATLERKIESDTGKKPEPGTGEKILWALQKRQPVATAHLEGREETPKNPGFIRAASGRVRHFSLHDANLQGLNARTLKGQAGAAGREARNFDMQNSVADTSAIACNKLLSFARKNDLRGRPIAVLYDSVVSLVPLEERDIWVKAHSLFMFRSTGWQYHNNILNYPIDTELNASWSSKPDKKLKQRLWDNEYVPTPETLQHIAKSLDEQLAFYTRFPEHSVINK